jgi:hypothetical protein
MLEYDLMPTAGHIHTMGTVDSRQEALKCSAMCLKWIVYGSDHVKDTVR